MINKKKRTDPEEMSYWMSYSDMMAALLLVFVLIIVFSISLTKKTYEEKERELEQQNKEIEEYEIQLKEQQIKLDAIIGVRATIVDNLKQEFSGSELGVSVDSETGAISFDSSILFDKGESVLTDEGIEFLNQFFPKYFDVILDDSIKEYVSEVIIEGHTDSDGAYLMNLNLSQARAFAVAEYCLSEKTSMFEGGTLETARELVTANGRAYYELVYDDAGNEDQDASRRVEIKFRLREDEMISEMSDILEK